jgi:hypothetical protein
MKKKYTSRQGAKEGRRPNEEDRKGGKAKGSAWALSCFPAFLILASLPWRLGALA